MTRTVQEEVADFLGDFFSRRHAGTSARNTAMALYSYGFGGATEPKLEAVAERFQDIARGKRLSKERVRQILERARGALSGAELPSVDALGDLVSTAPSWLNSDIAPLLLERGLVYEPFSISGLLRITKDTGRAVEYTIWPPDLSEPEKRRKRVGSADWVRRVEERHEGFLILNMESARQARRLLKHARRLHKKYGLARVDDLLDAPECSDIPERHRLLEQLLRASEDAWVGSEGGSTWYLFEDQQHVFKNVGDKVFSVTDVCSSTHLAEACLRYLAGRKGKRYPHSPAPASLIRRYFETSTAFEAADGQVRYPFARETSLGGFEKDLVACLKASPKGATGPQVEALLAARGHKKRKGRSAALRKSPLAHRVGKRGSYRYSLIGTEPDGSATVAGRADPQRYVRYRQLLDRLPRTDVDVEAKRRTEQKLLRRWLFPEERDEEYCALCKQEFAVSELVAAHKKKRKLCNPAERRDPDIVMPLCRLGCDFVYEGRHVVVRDGVTARGDLEDCSEAVRRYAEGLDGRKICDQWLAGKPWYFDSADRFSI